MGFQRMGCRAMYNKTNRVPPSAQVAAVSLVALVACALAKDARAHRLPTEPSVGEGKLSTASRRSPSASAPANRSSCLSFYPSRKWHFGTSSPREGSSAMAARTDIGTEAAAQRLGLLVLQPTPFCNIDCSYCYLSNRQSTARMSLETLALICRRVFESPRLGRQFEVASSMGANLWSSHSPGTKTPSRSWPSGGRPPCSSRIASRATEVLLNEDWARFFPEPKRGSNSASTVRRTCTTPTGAPAGARGRTKGDARSPSVAGRGARVPRDHGVDRACARSSGATVRFLPSRTASRMSASIFEEIEGANAHSSLAGGSVETKFRVFIKRFFDLVGTHPD